MIDPRELTDLQLAILGVLWAEGDATVSDIHRAMDRGGRVTQKTVATVLSRLEQRGVVRRRMSGRQGVYTALIRRRAVLIRRMTGMLGAIFDVGSGAPAPRAVDRRGVEPGDAARLRALLRKAERDLRRKP
jgi:BlaI family transcriptional regulator, penicillinase repressor